MANLIHSGDDYIFSSLEEALMDFKLVKRLGSGGFGEVLKVEHLDSGKTLAAKIISCINEDLDMLKGTLRELRILRSLTSMIEEGAYSHSIRLYDARLF